MNCIYQEICGGCPLRQMSASQYRQHKTERFSRLAAAIQQPNIKLGSPVFIADGLRRRAELTFAYSKGKILLGFNSQQSHNLIDIERCLSLTPKINHNLTAIRDFLQNFCSIKTTQKQKTKLITSSVNSGEIWITEAENGLDILLETDISLSLDHRMEISDFAVRNPDIIRVSHGHKNSNIETVVEKSRPCIDISGQKIFIPAGTFLQASSAGQQALINLVLKYIGSSTGNIADLFCGIGTFSFPLAANIKNKITAVDSSPELLSAFKQSINYLTVANINILQKNLFKYPLDTRELPQFDIIIFDPPRAGAAAQVKQIVALNEADKPQKIVAISCNPHTFINDANTLIQGGYKLLEMTMVDQFVYANHFELVALFEKS